MKPTVEIDNSAPDLPWYDSPWLRMYLEARAIIARESGAGRREEFDAAMRVFQAPPGFEAGYVDGLLAPAELDRIRDIVHHIPDSALNHSELLKFGRLILHDHPEFVALQARLTDQVSAAVGEAVEPSYNFLSLYNNLGVCEVHMDAPLAKWTVDICLAQSSVWPIHLSQLVPWPTGVELAAEGWQDSIIDDPALRFTTFYPEVDQALVFCGANQWHYRRRIPRTTANNFCHLLFLHFIPAGSAALADPANWADIFELEALRSVCVNHTGRG